MHTQTKLCMSLILTSKHPEPKGRIDEMLQANGVARNYSLMMLSMIPSSPKKVKGYPSFCQGKKIIPALSFFYTVVYNKDK